MLQEAPRSFAVLSVFAKFDVESADVLVGRVAGAAGVVAVAAAGVVAVAAAAVAGASKPAVAAVAAWVEVVVVGVAASASKVAAAAASRRRAIGDVEGLSLALAEADGVDI